MQSLIWILPMINFGTVLFGVIYGVAVLKASVMDNRKSLDHLQATSNDHEKRIIRLETRSEDGYGD